MNYGVAVAPAVLPSQQYLLISVSCSFEFFVNSTLNVQQTAYALSSTIGGGHPCRCGGLLSRVFALPRVVFALHLGLRDIWR